MEFADPTNYSLGSPKQAQQDVFGSYTKKDMNDYSQAAYNYLMHQQDNALQVALMNYMNQYNSPQHQMLMRQAAGLSPYSGESVQASPFGGSASPSFRSNGTYARNLQQTMNAVNTLLGLADSATKIYDYLTYGRDLSKINVANATGQSNLTAEKVQQAIWQTAWQGYLLGAPGYEGLGSSPQGTRYGAETGLTQNRSSLATSQVALNGKRIDQIEWLINNLYPEQKERQIALRKLDEARLGILNGQYGAIMNINTGNSTADGILKLILMFFRDNAGSLIKLF